VLDAVEENISMTVITNMHKLRLKNNNKQNKRVNGSNAEAKAKEQLFTVLPLRGQFLYYLICFFCVICVDFTFYCHNPL